MIFFIFKYSYKKFPHEFCTTNVRHTNLFRPPILKHSDTPPPRRLQGDWVDGERSFGVYHYRNGDMFHGLGGSVMGMFGGDVLRFVFLLDAPPPLGPGRGGEGQSKRLLTEKSC